ncbi:MAG: hemin uptake protein HemP [Gammaproteobacteria bacterium]|nr:hemin uptake protein HemP [Gammaproteobacteria bacterium]
MSNQTALSHNPRNQQNDAISISNLLKGRRYAWISHAGETYLLQLTKSNKLLLTK